MLSLKNNSNNLWILYYIVLGVIQAMWTNLSAFPPLPFRLIMIGAVFVPMFLKREMVIFGIPFFVILRGQLATDYQYIPDIHSYSIYIPLLLMLLVVHKRQVTNQYLKLFAPLICLTIYIFVCDLLNNYELGVYVINLFIVILFSLFISSKEDLNILSAALVSVCTLLAVYYILMYDQFLDTFNETENIERSGWNDPNYFSTLLGVGFLISTLYLLGYVKSSIMIFKRYFLIAMMIVIFIAVVLTASRAGFISVSLILLYSLVKSRPKFSTIIISVVLIYIVIYILYRLGFFDTLLFRLFEQGNMDTGGNRTLIWGKAMENFGSQSLFSQFFGGGYWHRAELSGGHELHNEMLAIMTDYGYAGLLLFSLLILSMITGNDYSCKIRRLSTIYYLLIIISLSPFQNVNIGFFIVWIILYRLDYNEQTQLYEKDSIHNTI